MTSRQLVMATTVDETASCVFRVVLGLIYLQDDDTEPMMRMIRRGVVQCVLVMTVSCGDATSQQVSVLYGRHVHPSVGNIRSHSSTFCCSLRPRRSMDSLGPLWASWFCRLRSSDLEQPAA